MAERKGPPKRVYVVLVFGFVYTYPSKRQADLAFAALSRFNEVVLGPYRYLLSPPKARARKGRKHVR